MEKYESIERYGLTKFTLLDYPGKVACTVFVTGCSFRCFYCHNMGLVNYNGISDSSKDDRYGLVRYYELFDFLKKRRVMLDGVCVSGGEPCAKENIVQLLTDIRKLGYKIKLDTNGYHPDKLKEIIDLGLVDYIAMDVKTWKTEYYARLVHIPEDEFDPGRIRESINLIRNSKIEYEFRTTVVNGLLDEMDIYCTAALIAGADKYFLQSYVGNEYSAYSAEEMHKFLDTVKTFVPNAELRGVD